jgi:Flp pilus assembly protein TadG
MRAAAKIIRQRVRDRAGAAMALFILGIFICIGAVALAVDVGMLMARRTESQRAADAAALGGAASFLTLPSDANRPRVWAKDYAARNRVDQLPAGVQDGDVDVLVAERKVRVRVRNTAARGNPVGTIFAHVLGWNSVDVGTVAAAEVSPAGSGICPLPVALPDRRTETDGDNIWDGPPTDLYEPYNGPLPYDGSVTQCPAGATSSGVGCDFTGYYENNINDSQLIEIKTRGGPAAGGSGNSICAAQPSWHCWFQPEAIDGGSGSGGTAELEPWIDGCPNTAINIHGPPNPTILYAASGSGNMQSLVQGAFKVLVDAEPGQWYQAPPGVGKSCATADGRSPSLHNPCLGSGPSLDAGGMPTHNTMRIRFMPLIDVTRISGTGSGVNVPVAALACVFVDKVAESASMLHGQGAPGRWNVYMRFTDTCTGLPGGGGPILQSLRLVE